MVLTAEVQGPLWISQCVLTFVVLTAEVHSVMTFLRGGFLPVGHLWSSLLELLNLQKRHLWPSLLELLNPQKRNLWPSLLELLNLQFLSCQGQDHRPHMRSGFVNLELGGWMS